MEEEKYHSVRVVKRPLRWKPIGFIILISIILILAFGFMWKEFNFEFEYGLEKDKLTNISDVIETFNVTEAKQNKLRIVSREEWKAIRSKNQLDVIKLPVEKFIIHHTVTSECTDKENCIKTVAKIQKNHLRIFDDIGYNFLIGGDGNVYEGRGWNFTGAHTKNNNKLAFGIGYIGDFTVKTPNEAQLMTGFSLFEEGIKLGFVKSDYKIFGACQFQNTENPGKAFYKIIQSWHQWSDKIK